MTVQITAKSLLDCMEGIFDIFLEEADTLDIAAITAARKRKIRNSTLAGFGVAGLAALTVWAMRARKAQSAAFTA